MIPLSPALYSHQSLFETVLGSSFETPAFDGDICSDVSVNIFAESNGPSAIAGTTKHSGAFVTDVRALSRLLYSHVLPSMSSVDLLFIESIEVDNNFSLLLYPYCFQSGEICRFLSILGNMRPTGYYTWDTQAMVPQSAVSHSTMKLSLPADTKKRVTLWSVASSNCADETTGTAVRVIEI